MTQKIMKKVIVTLIGCLLLLGGCKEPDYTVDIFNTWEEAIDITMDTLNERYPDDEFEIYVNEDGEDSVSKTDYGTAKVVIMYVVSSKYDNCIFSTYIRDNGVYKDGYGSCVYYEDSLSMFDYIIEGQDNVVDHDVIIGSNRYIEIYDTKNNTVYDYLRDTDSSTIFTIEIEDGTSDERIYELGEYAIGEIDKLGFRTIINIIIMKNGKRINLYAPMSGHDEDSIYHAREYYYESLSKENYNNGYLGNVDYEFTTVAEGKEIMFKVLLERYSDDVFDYVSEDFYKTDGDETGNIFFNMSSSKYDGCEFVVYMDADGSYYDSYLGCAFQDEISHFHDDLVKDDSRVLSHWGSSPYRQYYYFNLGDSFDKVIETNQNNNISVSVDLNIEIADGTSNEDVYEIVEYYIEKMNKKETIGYLRVYVKKNGEFQKIYGYKSMHGIDGYYFSEEQVNDDLKDNGYENGLN